jgi:signal transduction histidine kinase
VPVRRARGAHGATIQILLTGRHGRARYTVEVPTRGASQVALEQLPGPACFLSEGGRIAAHNPAFEAWAGRADVEGLPLAALFPGDPVVERLWDEARRGPVEHHVQRRARSATAASLWSLHAAPAATFVIVWVSDVTAFAQAAQAMHTAHQDYVAMGVHELRAPLAAIKAWAGALGAHPGSAMPAEGLAAIGRKVDQIDELIADLLDVARSDAAAVRPSREEIAIDLLVRRAVAASPHGARVEIEGVLPGRARVDASLLELALGKVLAFVARRHADGPIALAAEQSGEEIHVLVGDGGLPAIGEPALAEPELADPFGRASRFGRGRGAGLGLYLAQQLVAANGGRVWREPCPGGARFVVALPAALPTTEGPHREPRTEPFARLLLVEPDADRRARITAVLRLAGHDVTAAAELVPFGPGLFDAVVVDAAACGAAELEGAAVILVGPGAAGLPPGRAERAGALAVLPDPLDVPRLVALVAAVAAARGG